MKYAILNRIGASNWAPTNHIFSITTTLATLIFLIGTKSNLNFGDYVFDQTMKHVDSFVFKPPIDFPCLLTGIILSQYPMIIRPQEIPSKKGRSVTLNKKLFVGTHVLDIVVPQHHS